MLALCALLPLILHLRGACHVAVHGLAQKSTSQANDILHQTPPPHSVVVSTVDFESREVIYRPEFESQWEKSALLHPFCTNSLSLFDGQRLCWGSDLVRDITFCIMCREGYWVTTCRRHPPLTL